jgi:hypothetical protein
LWALDSSRANAGDEKISAAHLDPALRERSSDREAQIGLDSSIALDESRAHDVELASQSHWGLSHFIGQNY